MATQFSNKRQNGNFSEHKELQNTRKYNQKFQEYVGDIPPTLENRFITLQKEVQSKTYSKQSQCLRLQKRVAELEKKRDNMEILIEKSEFVNKDLKELDVLKIYSEKLEKDFRSLYTLIDEHKFNIMQQKHDIVEKQQAIRLLNQESIMLQSQFEYNNKQLQKYHQYNKIKKQQQLLQLNSSNNNYSSYNKKFQSSRQTPQAYSSGNIRYLDDSKVNNSKSQQTNDINNQNEQIDDNNNNILITQQIDQNKQKKFKKIDFLTQQEEQAQFNKIKKDIKKYQKLNFDRMNQVRKKATSFFELKKLMNETFDMHYRKIKKQTSTLKPPPKNQYHIDKPLVLKQNSASQDRAARNVIYDTIKQLILNKITQEEMDNMSIPLPQQMIIYESFKQFTTDQLLSLIYANPNYEKFIFHTLEIKMKAINLLQIRLKNSNISKNTSAFNSFDAQNSSIQNYNQYSMTSDMFA